MPDKTAYIETNKPLYIDNLRSRMGQNEALGVHDFEQWIFGHLDLRPGCDVLDVACGTGKAILKLLARHPEIGHVTGVDFAEPAIDVLRQRAADGGFSQVDALVLDMETLRDSLSGRRFDHIFSIYGVHYSPRMHELLCEYRDLLKPDGSIFFCGPDAFCNTKLMRILASADSLESDPIPARMLRPFIREWQLDRLRECFGQVELDFFENRVEFPDLETFLTWWRNHDLHREELETMVQQRVERELAVEGSFSLNKNVMGVQLWLT